MFFKSTFAHIPFIIVHLAISMTLVIINYLIKRPAFLYLSV